MPDLIESPALTALKAVIKLYGDDALDEIIDACVMAEKERDHRVSTAAGERAALHHRAPGRRREPPEG